MQADDKDVFAKKIKLSHNKGTIYQLLKEVSDQSGYLFIYDSQIIDNDKKVNIRKGNYFLQDAIYAITENDHLKIDVLGNHILLRLPDKKNDFIIKEKEDNKQIIIKGTLRDQLNNEPVIYASISVVNSSIGTISNQNGEFQLILPDSLDQPQIKLSHIGYESQDIESSLLINRHIDFYLKPKVVTLQEIVVRIIDPTQILKDVLKQKEKNYSQEPVCLTTFYREGIEHKKKIIDLTEAVLQIYKTGYQLNSNYDQAKLIKKRRISSKHESDTIFPRMKSGINSCLILDIIKELPDFIDPQNNSSYTYTHNDISMIDSRIVNVIGFEQKQYVREPLYTGNLFIEAESKALVEIHFEINPHFVNKATNMFIDKKAHDLNLSLQQAKYIVSYKLGNDGFHYINHVRGDISFKVKKKLHLLSSPLHFWFEMVTCKTDTQNVKGFSKNERLSPTKIFAETKHSYDKNFWENFNLILPEERLKKTIINNLNEVIINAE